jgi:DNA-binding MarR family transcriptional regulator
MPTYLESLGRILNFSTSGCNQICNKLLEKHNLSLPQWIILSALWREDGMLVSELAVYSGNNLPAASRVVDRMEKTGLVKRQNDMHDRRSVRVFLTNKSKKLSLLVNFYQEVNTRLMKGFTKKEEELLFRMLERIIENANTELNKAF